MKSSPCSSIPTSAPNGLLPKLCGGDLELGNCITDGVDPRVSGYVASRALLSRFDGVAAGDTPPPGSPLAADGVRRFTGTSTASSAADSQDWGRRFLFNGGCAYVDLNHLEVCLPEVRSARDHLIYTRALYQMAGRAACELNEYAGRKRVHVFANNSDGLGNSYGSHLNFLLSREAWENLFHRRLHYQGFFAAFQTSSISFTGLGKVASENRAPGAAFQLSQRADFMEVLTGLQTTYRRPVMNTRDEPLCGAWGSGSAASATERMARLHEILHDHNLSHVAALLKVGTLQIVLAMIEADEVDAGLLLDDPLRALQGWSRDPAMQSTGQLISGKDLTAVDLQLQFHERASRFVAQGRCEGIVPEADMILDLWEDTLEKLKRRDMDSLARRLDWALKLRLLAQVLERQPDIDWDSPELKHLDHLYSSLDPSDSLFLACERQGLTERLVSEDAITRATHEPPGNTRAWTRATLLLLASPGEVESVDWDFLRFRLADGSPRARSASIHLANPLGWTREEVQATFAETEGLSEAVAAIEALQTPVVAERTVAANK